ncbi:beta-1,3-glucosyltransferase [Neocloeon triangulifer]|uniref:beta-1,3-glucosyltransferase n=1 Tax=Neocloeon triangulifer TaxID=2078957 RepID=UPI00286EC2FF|nr:beta-1,3-glucosyltransferase [Neocloeon triangulifer]
MVIRGFQLIYPLQFLILAGFIFAPFICLGSNNYASGTDSIVIILLDQENDNNSKSLLNEFCSELKNDYQGKLPQILTVSNNFTGEIGAWTVIQLIEKLSRLDLASPWYFFALPSTRINIPKLLNLVARHDAEEPIWLGYGLHDREPTIIHHFSLLTKAKDNFLYPLFSSGFALSQGLLSSLSERWNSNNTADLHPSEFSIDPSYELALFVWNDGHGPTLTHSSKFCLAKGPNCVSYPAKQTTCRPLVLTNEIFFAVKTCHKFHRTRVPFVLQTWGKRAHHLALFSDVPDYLIPGLVDLKVPNTNHGHCGKTEAIIKYVDQKMREDPKIEWLVIADDDTILSAERLQEFLSCHSSSKMPLALGERYGFRVFERDTGYNYLTGGGGMVVNRAAVHQLTKGCHCPADDFPDDMFIMGVCLSKLGIPLVHSSLFHQARPDDYAPEYLAMQQPISFHKHWLIDPLEVYKNWFDADFSAEAPKRNVHIEL